MTWLERKENWLGTARIKPGPAPRAVRERIYTVQEVADIFRVDKRTVMAWLGGDDEPQAVIPPDAWFKLPGKNGAIRVREYIVLKLLEG